MNPEVAFVSAEPRGGLFQSIGELFCAKKRFPLFFDRLTGKNLKNLENTCELVC